MPDRSPPLDEADVDADPFTQFGRWYEEAAAEVPVPEAMAVATADPLGFPSVRMVLMKGWGPEGFVFHTNYDSRKARDLNANPHAALLFHWDHLGRQVRMDGQVARLDAAASDAYFATRPRGAQVAAYASHQSQPIASRGDLNARVRLLAAELPDPVPRPQWWGGYRLVPETFEFWQSRADRLHDRLVYARDGSGWRLRRLQP